MPFVLGFIAVAMIALGVRGTAGQAGQLLASEFTGASSFVPWFLALMILGLAGYWRPAKPVADGMLGLVILVILLVEGNPQRAGGGFFAQLNAAFTGATASQAAATSAGAGSGSSGAAIGAAIGNAFTAPSAFSPTTTSLGNQPGTLTLA